LQLLVLIVQSILRQSDGYIDLFVRVSPNASRDEINGIIQGSEDEYRLTLKVRAVPEKGKANKAVTKFLAKLLQVPKSSVTVTSGTSARQKTIRIAGDVNGIILSLEKLVKA
jgi:uncharacterized protein (TIGR00251 family)